MASKKESANPHSYTIAVVGLSGTEAFKGTVGVGKSCLCNRFVRPEEDNFYTDHLSLLSAADFNGQVVNNDHWLYWGPVTRQADDGTVYNFHIIEHTEFLDDTTFTPLRGGKTDSYLKRCSQIKVQSAEKLMYICRDQLGLHDEFEQVKFPTGKVSVDGFVCVADVSRSQTRPLEAQLDFVGKILSSLMKTKKSIVVAATKMDEGSDAVLLELHKLTNRKEFKGAIPVVETSALTHINCQLPFMLLATLIDKTRASRPKILSFSEADRLRQEKLDAARQAYGNILSSYVTEYRSTWPMWREKLEKFDDYNLFVELFGVRKARSVFIHRVTQLRQEYIANRKAEYLRRIPGLLEQFFPTLTSIAGRSWANCVRLVAQRSDFNQRFVVLSEPWYDDDNFLESGDERLPLTLFDSSEVEAIFSQHLRALQAEVKRQEYKNNFSELVSINKNVLPGAPLEEMEIFFVGRDCYDKLSHHDRADVYRKVQLQLRDRAKKEFLELLYERMDIFYKYEDPDTPITQEDVEALMCLLRSEPKCKALTRCEEDRKVIMLNHLGFLQYPIKEQCPFRPNCMEVSLQKSLSAKQRWSEQGSSVPNWSPNPQQQHMNLVIIGVEGLAHLLVDEIRDHFVDDEYHFNNKMFSLDYRTIDGDVSLPHNSLKTPHFTPHGCLCVYSSFDSLSFINECMNKTFLAANDDRLQYEGLPLVLLKAFDNSLSDKEHLRLEEKGRDLAHRLRCEYLGLPQSSEYEHLLIQGHFHETQIPLAMRDIAIQMANNDSVDAPFGNNKPPFGDIRLLMCHMCADDYPVDRVLLPFLQMQSCTVITNDRYHVIQFDTYISDVKRKVEVILTSYHEATLLRDEYCEGYILCYSVKRKASCSMLESFISKMPLVPSLVVAVSDGVHNEVTISLTNKGRFIADNNNSLFIATNDFHNQSPYTRLLREVWEYHERSLYLQSESLNSTTGTLESSFNSTSSGLHNSLDMHSQLAVAGAGRKLLTNPQGAHYLGGTWADNNDMYHRDKIHAPLADRVQMLDYEDPPDALSDTSEEYALVHDALPAGKIQRVQSTIKREFKPAFPHTDSESDLSSLERSAAVRSPVARRRGNHSKMGPRVASPQFGRRALSPMYTRSEATSTPERKSNSLPRIVLNRVNMDSDYGSATNTMRSDTPSEGSESAGDEGKRPQNSEVKRNRSLRSLRRRRVDGTEEETSLLERFRSTMTTNDPEKQRRKSMKRKQKEEEKVLRDKQKSVRRKLKSRLKRQSYLSNTGSGMTLQDYVQTEGQLIPKFVECCVKYLESEALSIEGVYRIPGNSAQVELLKEMFQHNKEIEIKSLDIGVHAVATALKGFFSDLSEPLVPIYLNQELVVADTIPEKGSRLLALRGVMKKLPPANHEVLRYLLTHLYRVSKYSEKNCMDSKNLAICWWPTLIRPTISSVEDMRTMGVAMQEIMFTFIEQHGFFFYNEHEV